MEDGFFIGGEEMVREKKFLCGKYYMDVAIYNIPENYKIKKYRNKRRTISSPQQKNLNDKRSRRYFRQLVHTNFAKSGYHLTLTYGDENLPPNLEDAKRLTDNYIRRLRTRVNKLEDKTFKYIIIDEYSETGRIHHHIILDCRLNRDEIETCWKLGRTSCDILQPNEKGLTELCCYLQKAQEDKPIKNSKCVRRWRASKNLKKPMEIINDNKYNRKKLHRFVIDMENNMLWEKQYPNWSVIEITAEANEYLGYSIYVKFRKKE